MNEQLIENPAFLVVRQPRSGDPDGYNYGPTKTHQTEQQAETEAMRLAIKHPGCDFDVIQRCSTVTAMTLQVTKYPKFKI